MIIDWAVDLSSTALFYALLLGDERIKCVEIKKYVKTGEASLSDVPAGEGGEWSGCRGSAGRGRYMQIFGTGILPMFGNENAVCGYAHCRQDNGFDTYNALEKKPCRRKRIGKSLMDDIDPSCRMLGYRGAGSILGVQSL